MRCRMIHGDADRAVLFSDRMNRIRNQIDDDLFQFRLSQGGRGTVVAQVRLNAYVGWNSRTDQVQCFVNRGLNGRYRCDKRLARSESENATYEIASANRGLGNLLQ